MPPRRSTRRATRSQTKQKEKVIEKEKDERDSKEEKQPEKKQTVKRIKIEAVPIQLYNIAKKKWKRYQTRKTSALSNPQSEAFRIRFQKYEEKHSELPKNIKSKAKTIKDNDRRNWNTMIKQFCEHQDFKKFCKADMYQFKNIRKNQGHIFNFLVSNYNRQVALQPGAESKKRNTLGGKIGQLATMVLYSNPWDEKVQKESNDLQSYANDIFSAWKRDRYGNNVLTEEELKTVWVPFEELVKVREELSSNFYADDFLEDRKRNPRLLGRPPNTKRYKSHFAYLLLACNTFYPPLRQDIPRMFYVEIALDIEPVNDKQSSENFLIKDTKTGNYFIVINQDKVSKVGRKEPDPQYLSSNKDGVPRQGVYKLDVNNKYIQCSELVKAFNHSFSIFPRKYVFPNLKSSTHREERTYTDSNVLKSKYGYDPAGKAIYKSVLSNLFPNNPNDTPPWPMFRIPTQNRFRQAYHTFWAHQGLTKRQKIDFALRMRHSWEMGDMAYDKIDNSRKTRTAEELSQSFHNRPLDSEIIKRVDELVKAKMNIINGTLEKREEKKTFTKKKLTKYRKTYNKVYFAQDCYGAKRQEDNRYLGYLLSGTIKKPKDRTLAKHGIKRNADGTYQFTEAKETEREKSENNCLP